MGFFELFKKKNKREKGKFGSRKSSGTAKHCRAIKTSRKKANRISDISRTAQNDRASKSQSISK